MTTNPASLAFPIPPAMFSESSLSLTLGVWICRRGPAMLANPQKHVAVPRRLLVDYANHPDQEFRYVEKGKAASSPTVFEDRNLSSRCRRFGTNHHP